MMSPAHWPRRRLLQALTCSGRPDQGARARLPGPAAASLACLFLGGVLSVGSPAAAQPTSDPGPSGRHVPAEAWRSDLERFRTEVILRDAAFSADARERALARLASLENRLSDATEVEVGAELARIAALAGNAHTRVDPLRNRGVWSRLPVRLWKFSDGWRVIAARPAHAGLIGARVLAVGDLPIGEAEDAVAPLFAGNAAWSAYMAGYSLTSSEALAASGVIHADPVVLTVTIGGVEQEATLFAEPAEGRTRPEENWWHLAPEHPRTGNWRHWTPSRTPLVFQRPELGYAFARCDDGVAYLRLNRTMDQPGRAPLADWGGEVLKALERDPPSRLIIDLRFNTGGDLSKALPFIGAIAASPLGRDSRALAVLVNGQTFSAGITQAAWLRLHSRAAFFGEPVGDQMSFWAEGDNVVLEHSGLTARYSTGAHHYAPGPPPEEMRDRVFFTLPSPALGPDHEIAWTWSDHAAGRDPVLEAVAAGLRCSPLE